jgi:predicted flap endonuclease-1-like 5' DNA nuclease
MPVLGYVGFILFAMEAVLARNFVSESAHAARHRWTVAAIALIFSSGSFAVIDRHTIFSYLAPAQGLPFLTDESREAVKRAGIETSFAIDPRSLSPEEKEALNLLHLRGLGLSNTLKLREHGIRTVEELSKLTDVQLLVIIGEANLRRARIYTSTARELVKH